ncbi:hypothetical protein B0H13DRAFT_2659931 [Mycena leptocephala]|nr:hypothetical protein B0H13DRAFT_2659931 [Mycena leptocephala]
MSSRLIYLRIVDKTRSHPHRASECPVPQRPRAIPLVPTSTLPSLPDPSRAPAAPTTSRIPAPAASPAPLQSRHDASIWICLPSGSDRIIQVAPCSYPCQIPLAPGLCPARLVSLIFTSTSSIQSSAFPSLPFFGPHFIKLKRYAQTWPMQACPYIRQQTSFCPTQLRLRYTPLSYKNVGLIVGMVSTSGTFCPSTAPSSAAFLQRLTSLDLKYSKEITKRLNKVRDVILAVQKGTNEAKAVVVVARE